jgi:glycosyltransferase involved in cell wall biosynthesis
MRVLTVTNMWPRRDRPAFGAFVQSQVQSLEALGVDIALHVIAGDRGAAAYALDVPAVRRAVRRFRPDIVHAHYGLAGWTAQWQPRPLVVSFCGDDLLGTPGPRGGKTLKSQVVVRMSQAVARRAAAIICKSRNLAAALERPADRARAHVIPNGVNVERFTPGSRDAARRVLGLDPAERLVLFPHAPEQAEQKGFALAEDLMQRVRSAEPAARLLHVTGVPHARMPDYYRAADCLLLTSKSEGSPNVVKEALACALPVVGVDAGDVQDWLLRVPGCRVVERRAEPLAGAVLEVLRSGTRVDASGIIAELDERAVARRIRAVYAQVARGPA